VGQTIVFCGLFGRACGPRNFMKKRPALELSSPNVRFSVRLCVL